MPIHDWTRLEPGDFHGYHLCWVVNLTKNHQPASVRSANRHGNASADRHTNNGFRLSSTW